MDLIQFFLRHAPWWGVPFMVIGGQFGYTFWLKDRRTYALAFFSIAGFGLLCIVYYMWAGGPEATPKHFYRLIMGR